MVLCGAGAASAAPPAPPTLAPAVAVEAEDFTIEKGWKVVKNGEGNYNVDIIGFGHIGGERLLQAPSADTTASASTNVAVPVDGPYKLWVRYEYPAFTEVRFKAIVEQGGKKVAEKVMGTLTGPRLGFGSPKLTAQHDPSWGPEGLFEEPMDVPGLKAGPAKITLQTVEQPQTPGVGANRNIDFIYLTSDVAEINGADGKPNPASWFYLGQGGPGGSIYPILNAFRDTRGGRWEVAVTNKGDKPLNVGISHAYNRVPWGGGEAAPIADVAPGATSAWTPLKQQDTAHFGLSVFTGNGPFELQIRPVGGAVEKTVKSEGPTVWLYIPAYPGKGEKPVTPMEEVDATLALLAKTPAPGKAPTVPLAYGGWIAISNDSSYGKKYGELYKAVGMRGIPTTIQTKAVMDQMGLPLTKSAMAGGFRLPPTTENAVAAKAAMEKSGLLPYARFFDYGDEIGFGEWVSMATAGKNDALPGMWTAWCQKHLAGEAIPGPKPDSSAAAAASNPRLYVNSLRFYEDIAFDAVLAGKEAVKAVLGKDVLCGANYSAHPFYFTPVNMYVLWFRRGAADFGRHSEYFWQVAQAGPMINGYVAEHFRAGMRNNPEAMLRQYTMPHSPGNTEASFVRTAFTHMAHGARALDYFGMGMNECFTENHIDHRDHERYRQIRDINHSMALVEDALPTSKVAPSEVALLLSESTERWDLAGVATDMAGHSMFGADFRKTKLHHHIDRLGLWSALTFAGSSPDLLIEEDLTPEILKGYKALFLVGDSIPGSTAKALEKWVSDGHVLVATGGVGRFGAVREPNPELQKLLGIASRQVEEKETFLRPHQELPFIKPWATISVAGGEMPALSVRERIKPTSDAKVEGTFADDKSPAVISRTIGKGKVFYVAAYPGMAYLWSALQPPSVPDRANGTHTVPVNFDAGAAAFIKSMLAEAKVEPAVVTTPALIDTRLVQNGKVSFLPMANYNTAVGQDVGVSLRFSGNVSTITSAYRGKLDFKQDKGVVTFTVPKLGYGDMVRIDEK
ncbi:MAG: beta-galactosidase trimerization domain-containing protein [Planctomycetota bacterium]|nr:beta-galactosidase trimerization domain-containing protein [Planctomycetota bacterium]